MYLHEIGRPAAGEDCANSRVAVVNCPANGWSQAVSTLVLLLFPALGALGGKLVSLLTISVK